jgi:PAS domain S-box-containing protein
MIRSPDAAAALALRDAGARFRDIFEHAPIGMVVTTLAGEFVHANPAMCRMLGRTADELSGCNVFDITHPDDRRITAAGARVFDTGDPEASFAYEKRYLRGDGSTIWVSVNAAVMRDDEGRAAYVVGQIMDITERVELERRLAAQRAELERSNAELAQFAAIASHDLREPLRVVSGYLDLLERRCGPVLDETARSLVGEAVCAAERMGDLIDGLLRYSRVGRADADRSRVDTREVVDATLRCLSAAVGDAGATVEVTGELPVVDADPALLHQLFQNLLANAVKFRNGRPPHVQVSAETLDDGWRFTVQDNGIGVPAEQAERIFEMFARASGAEAREGTGIGLAVCRRIVERHHGTISVFPRHDGPGSRFVFTLPRAAPGDPR